MCCWWKPKHPGGCVFTSKDKLEPAGEDSWWDVSHTHSLSTEVSPWYARAGRYAQGPWLSLPGRGIPSLFVYEPLCIDYFSPGSLFCPWRSTRPGTAGWEVYLSSTALHFCQKSVTYICMDLYPGLLFCSIDLCVHSSTNSTQSWLLCLLKRFLVCRRCLRNGYYHSFIHQIYIYKHHY